MTSDNSKSHNMEREGSNQNPNAPHRPTCNNFRFILMHIGQLHKPCIGTPPQRLMCDDHRFRNILTQPLRSTLSAYSSAFINTDVLVLVHDNPAMMLIGDDLGVGQKLSGLDRSSIQHPDAPRKHII